MTRRVEIAPEAWDCVRRLSDETPDGRVEVGPKEDLLAPLDVINMVSQVRQEYNQHDLAELRQAMIVEDDDGEKRIQLIQPITVGYFHRNDLTKYLEKLNDTWGTKHTIEEQVAVPGSHGRYFFLVVAGHRRTITIRQAAEDIGIDPSRVDVVFHVLNGNELTFREGIKTQYRENFHKRPESWEDAIAINAILQEGLSSGEYQTFADCAKDLGVNPERVSKAFRFNELPQVIQDMVERKVLAYGAAVEIHSLAVALAFRYGKGRYSQEETNAFVRDFEHGKMLLTDTLGRLSDDERDRWERELVYTHMKSDKIRSRTVGTVRDAVKRLSNEFVYTEEVQLTLVPMSEAEELRKDEQKQATTARRVLQGALREIVGVLEAEKARIQNGREPVLKWSAGLLTRTDQVAQGINALSERLYGMSAEELRAEVEVAIEAGRLALLELTELDAAEPDMFSEATRRLPSPDVEPALFA